jgi:hypothetical protein
MTLRINPKLKNIGDGFDQNERNLEVMCLADENLRGLAWQYMTLDSTLVDACWSR